MIAREKLYKFYIVLLIIFSLGMMVAMYIDKGFVKLISFGVLWCGVGILINSKRFADWTEKWQKRE